MGMFPNYEYDLAHNKIRFLMENLKKQSLIVFIQKLCRDEFITDFIHNNIENIISNIESSGNFIIANEIAELLTKDNIFKSHLFRSSDLIRFRKFIKETVIFVALQICDLLIKETVAKDEKENASLLLRNLTITRQGTIDLKKTIHRILKREQLPLSQLCELACYHFITHEIVKNHYAMVINKDIDYFVGHDKEQVVKKCFDFWEFLISKSGIENWKFALQDAKEMEKFTTLIFDDNDNRKVIINMFEEAVKYNCQIAVHYLWDAYVSNLPAPTEILRKILRISTCDALRINIDMYLLFHIESTMLDKRSKNKYVNILYNIVRNVRWHFLFDSTFNSFKFFLDSFSSTLLLNTITHIYFIDFPSQINIAKQYINSHFYELKKAVKSAPSTLYHIALKKPFLNAKKDLVNSLLSLGNEIELNIFLNSDFGIDLIFETIKIGNLEFVNNFLLERVRRSEILWMKNYLYHIRSDTLYSHFIKCKEFQMFFEVIDWFSEAIPESLENFLNLRLNNDNGSYIRHMIFKSNSDSDKDPFPIVDKFLLRCFVTNESVSSFKRSIILCISQRLMEIRNFIICYDEIKALILKSEWKFLGKFFIWREFTEIEKRAFYEKLFNDNTFLSQVVLEAVKYQSFLEAFSDFLKIHLDLRDSDMNIVKMKIFESVVDKYPIISTYIADWYNKEITKGELLSHIEESRVVFTNLDILNWLITS